jgi:hypothetical protein
MDRGKFNLSFTPSSRPLARLHDRLERSRMPAARQSSASDDTTVADSEHGSRSRPTCED